MFIQYQESFLTKVDSNHFHLHSDFVSIRSQDVKMWNDVFIFHNDVVLTHHPKIKKIHLRKNKKGCPCGQPLWLVEKTTSRDDAP